MGKRNWEDVRDLFRVWREENVRQCEDIVELWEEVLSSHLDNLGDEGWLVLEQVFVAALDCKNMTVANFCFSKLNQEFPGSSRVLRLKAMRYEATERYADALDVLESLIKKDETNQIPRKRKVAILKSQGKIVEAIRELADYLNIFMADQEAWLELADLYISQQDWNKAAFCLEELILHNPNNHLYLQRYAEIKYTQGDYDNLEVARSYYIQAAKLNPKNARALYGVLLTSLHISSSPKTISQKKKDSAKMTEWASAQLALLKPPADDTPYSVQLLKGLMGNPQTGGELKIQ